MITHAHSNITILLQTNINLSAFSIRLHVLYTCSNFKFMPFTLYSNFNFSFIVSQILSVEDSRLAVTSYVFKYVLPENTRSKRRSNKIFEGAI